MDVSPIIANPDDDLPRLVFADELEEQGDSDRAEFIRLQIANDPRADELLAIHRSEWIIPGIAGVQEFRRGFVESLRTSTAEFLAHQHEIAKFPVTDLRLPLAMDHLRELANVPWLNRVRSLDLTGNVGLGPRLEEFFAEADLRNLRGLELRNCQLWPEHVDALNRCAAGWSRLERLNLSGNPIGDAGLGRLCEANHWSHLQLLVLRCDEQQNIDAIHDSGAWTFLRSRLAHQLVSLDFNGHYIGNLTPLDVTLPRLEHIDVGFNEMGFFDSVEGLDGFCRMFGQFPNLRTLVFDGQTLSRAECRRIAVWPQLATMEWVSMRDCGLFEDDVEILQSGAFGCKFHL